MRNYGVMVKAKPKNIHRVNANDGLISYLSIVYELREARVDRMDSDAGPYCYRGQADMTWKVRPSIMRDFKPDAESQILSELLVEAPGEFGSDKSMLDKLVRAQHYSAPTRLVDVSLNPLVALYFACNDDSAEGVDGVVHVLDFKKSREKFSDSDVISVICNMSRLSQREREEIKEKYKEFGGSGYAWSEDQKKDFRSLPAVKRLMQFVRAEKPYFLDVLEPVDLRKYFFVYPAKNNKRIIAQSGAFVVSGLLEYLGLDRSKGLGVDRIVVPAGVKRDVLSQLDALNINSRSLFPEIEFAAKYIRQNWTV